MKTPEEVAREVAGDYALDFEVALARAGMIEALRWELENCKSMLLHDQARLKRQLAALRKEGGR
jgi:hypothetical protein